MKSRRSGSLGGAALAAIRVAGKHGPKKGR